MHHQNLRPLPSDLTDKEWPFLEPLLPAKAKTGRPRADDRQTLNGILYVLSTGCRWDDLPPERYGSGKTCWYRFKQWRNSGLWNAIAGILLLELNRRRHIDLANAYLDASVRQNKRGALIRLATRATRRKTA